MGAKEFIAGVRQAIKEGGTAQRVKPCAFGDFGAKCICLQLKPFGKAACADGGPYFLRLLDCGLIPTAYGHKDTGQQSTLGRALLLLRDVACNVMRRLMPDDKGDFIDILGIGDQGEVEGKDGAASFIQRLEGVGGLAGVVINRYAEVAIDATGARAADLLGQRFDGVDGGDEIPCGLVGGQDVWRRPGLLQGLGAQLGGSFHRHNAACEREGKQDCCYVAHGTLVRLVFLVTNRSSRWKKPPSRRGVCGAFVRAFYFGASGAKLWARVKESVMQRMILISGLALLVGCGTPQERCIAAATRDLRVVDRLIVQTQGNLDRGYALVEVERTSERLVLCAPGRAATATGPAQPPQMCWRDYDYTVTEARAINLADERETLAELQKKRVALEKASRLAVASCKLAHPE